MRAYRDEVPDSGLVDRHWHDIFPLMHKRYLFAQIDNFLFYDVWNEVLDYYDGAYNYPGAIKLSDDDNAEINNLRADANTFFAENYVLFLLGDKSFSEWDSFQEQLNALGMARITEIYQEAYDEYMAA